MRVLIADDNLVTRKALEAALTKWGHDVVVAIDGEQARTVLQAVDSPRLAILDWMMPKMDGIDVCREVRKWTDKPYTYIILLTGRDQQADIIEGLESGADDYLTKPYNAYELKARMSVGQRILDLHEQLAAARKALAMKTS